jgi:hypothetical protein
MGTNDTDILKAIFIYVISKKGLRATFYECVLAAAAAASLPNSHVILRSPHLLVLVRAQVAVR